MRYSNRIDLCLILTPPIIFVVFSAEAHEFSLTTPLSVDTQSAILSIMRTSPRRKITGLVEAAIRQWRYDETLLVL